jgi:hypothetical protein
LLTVQGLQVWDIGADSFDNLAGLWVFDADIWALVLQAGRRCFWDYVAEDIQDVVQRCDNRCQSSGTNMIWDGQLKLTMR